MYKISVPIQNSMVNESTKPVYLKQLKDSKVDRVFLITRAERKHYSVNHDELNKLCENLTFFNDNGFETGVWFGGSIGHGGPISRDPNFGKGVYNYSLLETLSGAKIGEVFCPLDENFVNDFANWVKAVAKAISTTKTRTIMMDDDYRLSQHGGELCCCCEKHLKVMSEYCGEPITREILREKAFKGARNKYRDAWVKAQGDSLRSMARTIRKAVDEANPDVTVLLCSAYSPWNIDGADALEITKILAGKNPPQLRLHSAPYWASVNPSWSLPAVIETARMLMSFCQDGQTEVFAEGDTYFRPRYNTPSSYLELFDVALRADGTHHGILKYMFDYFSTPEYETGYVDRHVNNLTASKQIEEMFSGSERMGVRVYAYPHTFSDSVLPENFEPNSLNQTPYDSGDILADCSIPSVYTGKGPCGLAFGESARHIPQDALDGGMILDAGAAMILHKQGVDVGIKNINSYDLHNVTKETFTKDGQVLRIDINSCRMIDGEFSSSIIPESVGLMGEKEIILSYRYTNNKGQKFLVFTFDGESRNLVLKRTYHRQKQLLEAIEWMSGSPLPVVCTNNPELYVLCARKNTKLEIALFNCFADAILNPVITVDKKYAKVKGVNCEAKIEENKVLLKDTIPAFSFVALELSE